MGHLSRDMKKVKEGPLKISGGRSFQAKERMCTKAQGRIIRQCLKNNHMMPTVAEVQQARKRKKISRTSKGLFDLLRTMLFKRNEKPCIIFRNKLHALTQVLRSSF